MGIGICPRCQMRYLVADHSGDYVHECNSGNKTFDQEDIFVVGDWEDYTTPVEPLRAHWNFEDGSGTTISATIGGVDLTASAGSWVAGSVSTYALHFTDLVTAGDFFSFGSQDFTITAWLKPLDYTRHRKIVGKGVTAGNQNEWAIQLRTNEIIRFYTSADGETLTFCNGQTIVPSAGTWWFVTVTKSGTDCTLYINGEADVAGTQTVDNHIFEGTGTFRVGEDFSGDIDELKIFSKALTTTEIKQIYRNLVLKVPGDDVGRKYGLLKAGASNKLFGTRAWIEGATLDPITSRGANKLTHRQRQHLEYIKEP